MGAGDARMPSIPRQGVLVWMAGNILYMTLSVDCVQSIIDPLHSADHGIGVHNIRQAVRVHSELQAKIGLKHNELMHKLLGRVAMCSGGYTSPFEPTLKLARKQDTLIDLPTSVYKLFLRLTGMDSKKDTGGSGPVVDAKDSQLLCTMLPYLFHRLATDEVALFNKGKPAGKHVADPSDEVCLVFTYYLKWYIRFRRPENSTRSLGKLQVAYKRYMDQLSSAMPFKDRHDHSVHGNVKVHWGVHGASQIALLGDGQNGSTCVTERKHSDALKKKERNTNNHAASFGYSILKNNGRELGARSMMQDIAGTLCSSSFDPYGTVLVPYESSFGPF